MVNGDVSPLFIAGNRVIEISGRGTDTQAGYVAHFVTAVSRSNIRTFTAQPLMYTAYAGHTVCTVLNGDVSPTPPPFIASNREREISAHATATQAGYVDHFITAVSRFNIHTFTAQPLMYTAYAGRHILYVYGIKR